MYKLINGDKTQSLNIVDLRDHDFTFQGGIFSLIEKGINHKIWSYANSMRVEVKYKERVDLYIFNKIK